MGVSLEPGKRVVVRPYTSSLTYANLLRARCGVVNLTNDPELFYRMAFKDANPGGVVPPEWFEKADIVEAPRLRMAEAYAELVVEEMGVEGRRASVVCRPVATRVVCPVLRPYCRGAFAAIEATIHATRLREFMARGIAGRASELERMIAYYGDLARRVSPSSPYTRIIEELSARVGLWREEFARSR